MKNTLIDLQNHLFARIEAISDESLTDEEFNKEIKRSLTLNELAKSAIENGALMVKAADTLYGLPVSSELPLIPPGLSEKPVLLDGKRKSLIEIPKAGK